MTPATVDVLIVDDSAIVRGLLTRALETDPTIRVVGSEMHGQAALRWLGRKQADVVLLDVEMPVLDGLQTLERLQVEHPDVRVIMVSSVTRSGTEATAQALSMGAVSCISKPNARSASESIEIVAKELVPLVKELGQKKHRTSQTGATLRSPLPLDLSRRMHSGTSRINPELVVVGSSTGGPRALAEFVKALPYDFDLPICIVQHMPPYFTPMLARHLATDSGRPCHEVRDGMSIERGKLYVAPGDYHVELVRREERIVGRLNQGAPEHFCRPSVNPLFRSAANVFGPGVIAVMLTGMGEDGIEGTRDVFTAGGTVIAQDEASSVVWGMPGAVARAGLAHHLMPPAEIGFAVAQLCVSNGQLAAR